MAAANAELVELRQRMNEYKKLQDETSQLNNRLNL